MNNRLQFRHHNEVFATRELAIDYIKRGIENATEGLAFKDKSLGFSLFAEPTILKYVNEDDELNPHIILAIGSYTNEGTQYSDNRFCIIDIDKTEKEIADIEEELINIVRSLTIITRDTPTLSLYSERTDEGTILSGNVNVAETHIFNDIQKRNNILQTQDGLFVYVDLKYDEEHESFTFSVSNADDTLSETTIQLPNNYLVRGNYDSADDSLHLFLRDGQEVVVSLEYIINLIDTVSADTLTRLRDIINIDHSINVDRTNPVEPVIAVNLSEEVEDSGRNIIKLNNDGLFVGVDLDYHFDSGTSKNVLVFKTSYGTKTFDLKTNSVVDYIYYDPIREAIVIEYTVNGKRMPDVVVPVGGLIDEWRVEDGHPHAVLLEKERIASGTSGQDILKASVVITNTHDDNMLVMDEGALYVSSAGIASNKAEIDSLKGRMATAENNITTLSGDLNTEVIRAISAETALSGAIDTERTRAMNVENILSGNIINEFVRADGVEQGIITTLENEINRSTNRDDALEDKIDGEIARSTAKDNELLSSLTAEITRSTSAETELRTAISNETTRATNKENSLEFDLNATMNSLSSEISRSISADNTLQDNINNERTRATSAENALQTAINNESVRAMSAETKINRDLTEEAGRAYGAEQALQTGLSQEIERSTSKDTELDAKIDGEITRSTNKDTELAIAIHDEYDRASSAETALQNALSAETTRATNAESTLQTSLSNVQSSLNTETNRALSAEATLRSDLNTEVSRAQSAETAISAELESVAGQVYGDIQALQVGLDNEETRARNEEARIETKLDGEITRSTNKDNAIDNSIASLSTAISDEEDRAEAAEATLQANIGIEQSRATNAEATLQGSIAAENSRALLAEQTLQSAINAEVNRASNVESAITTNLDNEINRATLADAAQTSAIEENTAALAAEKYRAENAESALTRDITAEESRAILAEQALQDAINAETTRAENAESALTVALNTEKLTRIHMDSDLQAAIASEESRAREAEGALQTSISTEVSRAQRVEEQLNNNLIAEIARATSSETASSNALSDEITRATNAETAIRADLESEVTRAANAESSISTNLASEVSRATAEEARLNNLITAETTNRTVADTNLSNRIDNITYTFGETTTARMSVNNKVVKTDVKIPVSNDNIIVPSDGIKAAVDLTYNPATNVLTFSKSRFDGTTTSMTSSDIALSVASVIDDISYDEGNKKIIISYHSTTGEHKTTEVDVSDLFNDWDVAQTHNGAIQLAKITNGESVDIISGSVVISQSENNILRNIDGSLFVDGSNINTVSASAICTKNELKKIETAVFGDSVSVPDCGGNFKYTPSEATKYIASATSINGALTLLDSNIFTVSSNTNTVDGRVTTVETNANCTKNALEKFEKAVIGHVIANCGDNFDYEKNQGANYINTATSFNSADVILDTELKKSNDAIVVINQKIEELSGGGGSYRLEIDNIERGSGLDDQGYYVPQTNAHYINTASSLFNADVILDTEIYNLNQYLKITSFEDTNSVDFTNTNGAVKADVKLSSDSTNALSIKNDGLYVNNDLNCGEYTEGTTTEDDYSNEARQ